VCYWLHSEQPLNQLLFKQLSMAVHYDTNGVLVIYVALNLGLHEPHLNVLYARLLLSVPYNLLLNVSPLYIVFIKPNAQFGIGSITFSAV